MEKTLARKRKKSRKREEVDEPTDFDDEVLFDLDADLHEELNTRDSELSSEPKWLDVSDDLAPPHDPIEGAEEDVIEISLDDDEADADRDRLIAEALAFVGDSEVIADEDFDAEPAESEAADVDDAGAETATYEDGPLVGGAYALPPAGDNAPPPRITAGALEALSEFRTEGLARLPDEVVVDLGDPDGGEDRDRLLQAALAHAEMQEAIYRIPGEESKPRSAKPYMVAAVVALAVIVTAAPPSFLTPPDAPTVRAADRLHGHRVTLLMQAQQVEAFRSANGRLPTSLAELENPLPGMQFVKSNNRLYQLVLRTEDRTLIYDSATPDPLFASLAARWVTTRNTP